MALKMTRIRQIEIQKNKKINKKLWGENFGAALDLVSQFTSPGYATDCRR